MVLPRCNRQPRKALLLGAAACLASHFAGAAEPAPVQWDVSAGVRQRTLSEWSDRGTRLLTEKGALARLQLDAQVAAPGSPVLGLEAAVADGRLDYEGRTQAGVPLATSSRHRERELVLRWRPLPPAAWGETWLGLGWLHMRRAIASSPMAGGLTETSSLVMPAIRWRSPAFKLPQGGTEFRLEAEWRASARHRLEVDYLGVFDNSSLRGGRRSEGALRLTASAAQDWRWTLEWRHARQSASESAALYRRGVPVGSVRQPRLQVDDLTVSLTRRF